MTSKSSTAREAAYRILVENAQSEDFLEQSLANAAREYAPRELAQIRYLTTTTLRRKLTLDCVLKHFIQRSVEPDLWILMKLGATQVLFGDPVHRHADVNETVDVARRIGKPRWCKFLNGVLRNLDRACLSDPVEEFAAYVYPVRSRKEMRSLNKDLFSDPVSDWNGYLSQVYSLPQWLVDRWVERFHRQEILALADWSLSTPRMCLRINMSKISREEILNRFAGQKIQSEPGHLDCSLLNIEVASPTQLPGWDEGLISVQDETAQQAALTLAPLPGESVWDMCAAPGTKTIHLAELMQGEGEILATDINPGRLKSIRENLQRCGVSCVKLEAINAQGENLPEGPFDAILIDAPCSNTGVIGKRVDVRWRVTLQDVEELARIQKQLLEEAQKRLNPSGRILYSTCSIEREENEAVIEWFLRQHTNFECVQQQLFMPGMPSDGGFQALLRKSF